MTEPAVELAWIADELRALAANGLHYAENHYDRDRYTKLRAVAVRAMALVEQRSAGEIEAVFAADLGLRTPLATADMAVFDEADRLLLTKRSDTGQWCMPGGAADVGESASQAAVRECLEETGLRVRATALLGLYDNRRFHVDPPVQTYCSVFGGEVTGGELVLTPETLDAGWFTAEQAAELDFFRGHRVKVPDMFAIRRGETPGPIFH